MHLCIRGSIPSEKLPSSGSLLLLRLIKCSGPQWYMWFTIDWSTCELESCRAWTGATSNAGVKKRKSICHNRILARLHGLDLRRHCGSGISTAILACRHKICVTYICAAHNPPGDKSVDIKAFGHGTITPSPKHATTGQHSPRPRGPAWPRHQGEQSAFLA